MPTFELVKSDFKKTFPMKDGTGELAVYEVELKDGENGFVKAEIVQKPSSPAPALGPVEGTLEPGQYAMKFKRAKAAFNGGGFKGKSPEERAEMRRMSAQKQAIALLDVELKSGLIPAEKLAAVKASELLKPRIDFFDDDAKAAG